MKRMLLIMIFFGACKAVLVRGKNSEDFAVMLSPVMAHIEKNLEMRASSNAVALPVVAVAGCSAVGKSYFVSLFLQLCKEKGLKVVLLKYDDFLDPAGIPQDRRMHPGQHAYFDAIKLHAVWMQIKQGNLLVTKPVFKKPEEQLDLREADIIVVDGEFALSGPEYLDFFKYCTFGIFIEAAEENIRIWKRHRENLKPEAARRTVEKFNADMEVDMQNYHNYIVPTKERALFVVHKDANHAYSLESK